jgi:hypothetical protein
LLKNFFTGFSVDRAFLPDNISGFIFAHLFPASLKFKDLPGG